MVGSTVDIFFGMFSGSMWLLVHYNIICQIIWQIVDIRNIMFCFRIPKIKLYMYIAAVTWMFVETKCIPIAPPTPSPLPSG